MGRVFSIVNQKGGVGKTTTAVNLSASLAAAERRVLLIDFDPQGNATSGLGVEKERVRFTIYHALIGEVGIGEVVRHTVMPFLQLIPSNADLIGAEVELVGMEGREYRLKEVIGSIQGRYDYIFIDCPPSLGLLTVNALVASDHIIIPLQCEYYALEGLGQLLRTVERIRKALNPSLSIKGILLTMFDPRTTISHQVEREIRDHFNGKVFKTVIPRNVRLSEAPSFGKPVLLYDIRSKGALSYLQLAREFIRP